MKKNKKVTMQEIANQLGVSKVTVSKALNNKDGVSDQVRKQIIDFAEDHGYNPRNYGTRRSKKIGVIVNAHFASDATSSMHYLNMYKKISSKFSNNSCTCILITSQAKNINNDLKMLQQEKIFDGLLLLGILDNEVNNFVAELPLPKIYVDIYDQTLKYDSVVTDNIYSTYHLTKHLISYGHKDIGFVGTVGSTNSITDRYLGYLRALIEENLTINNSWILNDRDSNGIATEIILPDTMPTAFVSNCDETSNRLINTLTKNGFKLPDDVSIVSFDNDIYATLCEPNLTTVAIDFKAISNIVVENMLKLLNNDSNTKPNVYRVPGKIIYRDSVKKL